MTRGASAVGWQVILADLSLILFLVALAGLSVAKGGEQPIVPAAGPAIAPSQALYRHSADGPDLREWLAGQQIDPRATLTVFVTHGVTDRDNAWTSAYAMADEARRSGVPVRVIMEEAERSDIYASLAFDNAR